MREMQDADLLRRKCEWSGGSATSARKTAWVGRPAQRWGCVVAVLALSARACVCAEEHGACDGDCAEGQGTYTFPDGSVYTGSWSKHRFHGRGEMQYANGEVYKGKFKHGKRHGKGRHAYPIDSTRYAFAEGTQHHHL